MTSRIDPGPDVHELTRMHGVLIDDVRAAARAKQTRTLIDFAYPPASSLSERERRTLVRAVFAYFDAMTYVMKRYALDIADDAFAPEERMMALEVRYDVAANGRIEERAAKINTLSNRRLALRMMAKAWSLENYELDVTGHGWKALAESIKVRDHLTHPRRFERLQVSDDEAEATLLAFDWFVKEMLRLVEIKFGPQLELWKTGIAAASGRREDADWEAEPE